MSPDESAKALNLQREVAKAAPRSRCACVVVVACCCARRILTAVPFLHSLGQLMPPGSSTQRSMGK